MPLWSLLGHNVQYRNLGLSSIGALCRSLSHNVLIYSILAPLLLPSITSPCKKFPLLLTVVTTSPFTLLFFLPRHQHLIGGGGRGWGGEVQCFELLNLDLTIHWWWMWHFDSLQAVKICFLSWDQSWGWDLSWTFLCCFDFCVWNVQWSPI